MSYKLLVVCLSMIAVVALLAGCPSNSEGTGYSIDIYRDNSLIDSFTLDELSVLEKVAFTADNKDEEGLTLQSVLQLAGIEDFTEVTIFGLSKGRFAEADITLTQDQINDKVILGFTNRSTCKLAAPSIPSNDWIIDVDSIRVK